MRKLLTIFFISLAFSLMAQQANHGFSYQAVVRNAEGQPLDREDVTVKITLFTKEGKVSTYKENHFVTTDQFGQINLIIGEGEEKDGDLTSMPWSKGSVYYQVEIIDEDHDLELISEAKVLAVPYALHALTADAVKGFENSGSDGSRMNIEDGKFWTVIGNNVQGGNNLLGTLNRSDLNIITSGQSRIFINDDGPIEVFPRTNFVSDVNFDGSVKILKDLAVNGTTRINGNSEIDGSLIVGGEGVFQNNLMALRDLDVFGNTRLSRNLTAGGAVELNGGLTVGQMSPALLTGTLQVDKESTLKDDLTVEGFVDFKDGLNVDGAVDMNNSLTVDGSATFNNSMLIEGSTTINDDLYVTKDVADGQYLATFYNSNSGNGDGINIKLGKNRTSLAVPTVPQLLTPSQVNDIKNLIKCDYPGSKINLLGNIVFEGVQADIQMIAGLAIGIGNHLINFINGRIGLPLNMPTLEVVPEVPVFPGFGWQVCIPDPIDFCRGFYIDPESIGPYSLPNVQLLPAIPNISLSDLGIQEIPIYDLNFWGIPNICLDDAPGTSPLNNENEFIRFSDNNDTKMGSIRAVSVSDWSDNYLTPSYLFKLHGAITSAVDKKHARYHFKGEVSKAIQDYVKIGVEYSSGNGDYAEWLERIYLTEEITPGDIVGVVGGKITKNLEEAEQVMVVSHNPIVLGNIPPSGEVDKGNNIAFMGQVPVKVQGPVSTGDYIVALKDIPGYGIAKSEEEMSIEDYKLAVGRSWENATSAGPKMVNTVVGIHNGDYSKILQKFDVKIRKTENRMDHLEARMNTISEMLQSND